MIKNLELDRLVYNAGFNSYEKLAEYMEVTNATIYSWRSGKTLPRLDRAIKLSETLKVEPKELFEILINNNWYYQERGENE